MLRRRLRASTVARVNFIEFFFDMVPGKITLMDVYRSCKSCYQYHRCVLVIAKFIMLRLCCLIRVWPVLTLSFIIIGIYLMFNGQFVSIVLFVSLNVYNLHASVRVARTHSLCLKLIKFHQASPSFPYPSTFNHQSKSQSKFHPTIQYQIQQKLT